MSKKILIVSRSFFPLITPRSFRTTELAKEFSRQGHDVTVIVPIEGFDYEEFKERNNIKIKNLGKLHSWEQDVRGSGIKNTIIKLYRAVFILLFDYPSIHLSYLVRNALKNESEYDLLISIAAPHSIHWGVASIRTSKNKIANTWIADCGDPYIGASTSRYPRFFYFKYVEKWFCSKADYITVPFEQAKNAYYKEFRNKIRVIPQGYSNTNIQLYKGRIDNKVPTFAYAGTFLRNVRDPKNFLEYLIKADREFMFHVYTNKKQFLEKYIEKLGDKIKIHDKLPRETLLYELSKMDFLVNFENNSMVQKPSKLVDYAFTGRPILNIDPNNIKQKEIEQFFNKNYAGQVVIDDLEQYDVSSIAKNFIALSE